MEREIIVLTRLPVGFRANHITLSQDSNVSDKELFCEIGKQYPDSYLIDPVTMSPVTFDTTLRIESHTGSLHNSDIFAVTYNELQHKIKEIEHVSKCSDFCRIIKSKSGRVGEFLSMFAGIKPSKNGWHVGGIFNNPEFYFENRK